MKLGVDVGYSHTKVVGKNCEFNFKSTIEEGALDISGDIIVEFEGKTYTIGENSGLYSSDLNKINTQEFRIWLYTAIAMAMKNKTTEEIDLVTGLPADYYQSQKNELIDSLKGQIINITLNGKPKRFEIKNVIVFPQSTGILLLNPEKLSGDVSVIDIGGYTVDISVFSGKKLRKLYTIEEGMNNVATKLVQAIKSKYSVSYDVLKADDLLNNKEIVKNNESIDIEDLIDDVLEAHFKLIENRLKGIKEYNSTKHIFVGGGSMRLAKFIKSDVEKDPIYTNARAFYKIGVEKFED